MNKLIIGASAALLCSALWGVNTSNGASLQSNLTAGARQAQPQDERVSGDVQEKIKALASANANERAEAACALGEMGERAAAAIPALINLLGDDTPVEHVECWKDNFRRGNFREGKEETTPGERAAGALAQIGKPAVEPLIVALKSADWRVRKNASFALGVIRDERTVDALLAVVGDREARVRAQAVWGLGLKHDARVVDPLVVALSDGEWQVREKAAWSLGLRGNSNSVEPLINALRDENSEVRSQAAWALGLRGDARAVEPLIAALTNSDGHMRRQVAWALGLKGDRRAVLPLVAALKDEDGEVRAQAAWALGLKGDKRAIEALTVALKDSDEEVREKAAWALRLLRLKSGVAVEVNPEINVELD
jgi:HEAT repeat protein